MHGRVTHARSDAELRIAGREALLPHFRKRVQADLQAFGEYLIHSLDHHGRLQSSLPEILQVYGGGISQEEALSKLGEGKRKVEETLEALQQALRERLLAYLRERFTHRDFAAVQNLFVGPFHEGKAMVDEQLLHPPGSGHSRLTRRRGRYRSEGEG